MLIFGAFRKLKAVLIVERQDHVIAHIAHPIGFALDEHFAALFHVLGKLARGFRFLKARLFEARYDRILIHALVQPARSNREPLTPFLHRAVPHSAHQRVRAKRVAITPNFIQNEAHKPQVKSRRRHMREDFHQIVSRLIQGKCPSPITLRHPAEFEKRLGDRTGAYLLCLHLKAPITVALRGGDLTGKFPPGAYVYAGNAHGPGGLQARLRRHFDKKKRLHWHVDRVTTQAAGLCALAFPGGDECDLIGHLLASGAFTVPVRRFGSSDCRVCPSHFLRWVD